MRVFNPLVTNDFETETIIEKIKERPATKYNECAEASVTCPYQAYFRNNLRAGRLLILRIKF